MNGDIEPLISQLLLSPYLNRDCPSEDDYSKRAIVVRHILRENFKKVFEKIVESRNYTDKIMSQIIEIWGHPLDLLELQVQLSKEAAAIAGDFSTEDYNFRAIRIIHGRGCHVAAEILYLLKGGFSDAAEARWRTLYELTVISEFICLIGNSIGQRYISYEAVEMRNYYKPVIKYYENLGEGLSLEEKTKYEDINKSYESANKDTQAYCELYGKSFERKDYGWAACAFKGKAPNFAEIEKKVGNHIPSVLRNAAHFPIHVGPRAALYRRGLPEQGYMLMGPSVYGLKDLINNTSIALDSLNSSLYSICDYYKILSIYDFQSILTEEIMEASSNSEIALGPFHTQS